MPFSGTGGDSSTIIRMALVDIGWDLFYQSPITGVGVNNPSVFTYFVYGKEITLHNNYIELLAGTGQSAYWHITQCIYTLPIT